VQEGLRQEQEAQVRQSQEEQQAQECKEDQPRGEQVIMRTLKKAFLALVVFLGLLVSASSALAVTSFGSFTNPNGIAVDESAGAVYVADLGTGDISKFDATGNPLEFSGAAQCKVEKCGYIEENRILGTPPAKLGDPAVPFAFPSTEPGNPAAIAVDNSADPSDPSRGDLYVLDAGHEAIDKFNANGEALTPITGPFSGPPVGVGVDANGDVRVDVRRPEARPRQELAVDVFDDSAANGFIQLAIETAERPSGGAAEGGTQEYGFASGGQSGDSFALLSCGCVAKLGLDGEALGRVDDGATAVAAAVDPATGHVYVDDQSALAHSVGEWDTGEMNGPDEPVSEQIEGTGTLGLSFALPQLTPPPEPEQGGIAVDGATGDVYVSNPADGKVYVFAGTAPVAAAGTTAHVTQMSATLEGTVDPRGVPLMSCRFYYDTSSANDLTLPLVNLGHSAQCIDESGEPVVGSTSPVTVHADVSGLQPGSLYHLRLVVGNADGATRSGSLFPTVSAGFGIKQFEVSFLNRDGTPDVQAGSHPFKMVTNIVFNKQVVPRGVGDPRYVALPQGNAKDVTVHLPPGFYGDPNATVKKCTLQELVPGGLDDECPAESEVGFLEAEYKTFEHNFGIQITGRRALSIVPPPGVAFQIAAHILVPNAFIDVGVPAGGDSGVTATAKGIPVTVPVFRSTLTVFGIPPSGGTKPLLTLPTSCNGPLTSTISADSYQNAGHFATASTVTPGMSNCAPLVFPPSIETHPDVSNASSSSGLNVHVNVSQKAAQNPTGVAESTLRDTTVALPPGVAVNPSGADGLEACSEGLGGFHGFAEFSPAFEPGDQTATFSPVLLGELQPGVSFCPDGSKIGTAELKTPLLSDTLKGSVYLATPAPNGEEGQNPSNSLIAMYMMIEDPVSGTAVKIPFKVQLCQSAGQVISGMTCQATGQIITTAHNTPQLPFEDLQLHFFGGERAPLATPSHCGTYTTLASFTPWSGNAPVNTSASFQVGHGPGGGPCSGQSLPFNPSLTGGSSNIQAGGFTPFTMTMSREDGEQNLQAISLKMPPGLSGLLTGVKLCGEAEANAGICGADSEIGETTVSVGVGSNPFSVKGGRVYITGPYKGAPFGLSIVNPADAGPFHLGKVIVRAKIEVDPITTALTITSDNKGDFKIPQYIKGIPLQIKHVNVTITRPGFTFNPTSCNHMQIGGSLSSAEGASQTVAVPFQAHDCATLKFAPKFAVSTSGKTSKARGASLKVKLAYPKAPFGSQANIRSVKVDLPKQLPSRLTTLQKACTAAQFKANPAGCPAASLVGHAKATTPLIPVPLEGPAYFVSNGGQAFPNLIMVLQGYGVTVDLVGDTFISKKGITSSTFKTVPDAPVGSFELTLPQGKFSALTANGNLCKNRSKLKMPTAFTAQNGATIHKVTKIAVTGCPKLKKAKKKGAKRSSPSHRHGRRATGRK
jgi:hypothetical protein